MNNKPKKVIVLHSGGMDSSVLLLKAIDDGHEALSLGYDYEQKQNIELSYAKDICDKYNIKRILLKIELYQPDIIIPTNRELNEIKSSIAPTYIPGRNILFLINACILATKMKSDEVWIGINSIDYSGYPDCRPEFINSFNSMLLNGYNDPPEIVAPLLYKTKNEIAELAIKYGLKKEDTWSCYNPHKNDGKIVRCGICDACILNNKAWERFA